MVVFSSHKNKKEKQPSDGESCIYYFPAKPEKQNNERLCTTLTSQWTVTHIQASTTVVVALPCLSWRAFCVRHEHFHKKMVVELWENSGPAKFNASHLFQSIHVIDFWMSKNSFAIQDLTSAHLPMLAQAVTCRSNYEVMLTILLLHAKGT